MTDEIKITSQSSKYVPGGLMETMKIAIPLLFSQAAHAVNLFIDRAMLSHYAVEATGASCFAGLVQYMFACFFVGIVLYTGTFVSQFYGARRFSAIGCTIWHGMLLAFVGGIILALQAIYADWLFKLFNHAEDVQNMEVGYFKILSYGSFVFLSSVVLSSFWSGRGRTMFVMIVSFITTLCNIPFNAILIFGNSLSWFKFGWAPMGIAGAAYGTIASEAVGSLVYLVAFLSPRVNRVYKTYKFRLSLDLLWRMIRFGFANGFLMFMDLVTFNIFVIIVSALGTVELISSSIALGINSLAFNICCAMGQASALMTGKYVGAKEIANARRGVRSALLASIFMCSLCGIMLAFYPEPMLMFFHIEDPVIEHITRNMLRFIGAYLLSDGAQMVFSNAIRAAGDTKVAMQIVTIMGWACFAIPCFGVYLLYKFNVNIFFYTFTRSSCLWCLWSILDFYVLAMMIVFIIRYHSGKWTKMSVID